MDSDDDYEYNMDTRVTMEQGYAVEGYDEEKKKSQ